MEIYYVVKIWGRSDRFKYAIYIWGSDPRQDKKDVTEFDVKE